MQHKNARVHQLHRISDFVLELPAVPASLVRECLRCDQLQPTELDGSAVFGTADQRWEVAPRELGEVGPSVLSVSSFKRRVLALVL